MASSSKFLDYQCLFSSQKMKKRKSYSDGVLRLYQNEHRCELYRASDNFLSLNDLLETRILSPDETGRFRNYQSSFEIEFENFLVSIEELVKPSIQNQSQEICTNVSKLPSKKFKIPSVVKSTYDIESKSTVSHAQYNSNTHKIIAKGKYEVTDDDIDNIWGENSERNEDISDVKSGANQSITSKYRQKEPFERNVNQQDSYDLSRTASTDKSNNMSSLQYPSKQIRSDVDDKYYEDVQNLSDLSSYQQDSPNIWTSSYHQNSNKITSYQDKSMLTQHASARCLPPIESRPIDPVQNLTTQSSVSHDMYNTYHTEQSPSRYTSYTDSSAATRKNCNSMKQLSDSKLSLQSFLPTKHTNYTDNNQPIDYHQQHLNLSQSLYSNNNDNIDHNYHMDPFRNELSEQDTSHGENIWGMYEFKQNE